MKVRIVGERGYVGSNLAKYLLSKGHELSEFDVGCTINCAQHGGKPGQNDLEKMVRSNILLPLDLVKHSKLIHLASSSEIVEPDTIYSRTKSLATEYLHGKATIVYIYTAYGGINQPMHMFMTQLLLAKKNNKKFRVSTPEATRDFVHINRICDGIEQLMYEPIQEVHFGHGKARKMADVARHVLKDTHIILPVPEWKAANPYFKDTFEEDLKEELCAL